MHPFTLSERVMRRMKTLYAVRSVRTGIYSSRVWQALKVFDMAVKNHLCQDYPIILMFGTGKQSYPYYMDVLEMDVHRSKLFTAYETQLCYVYRALDGEVCYHTSVPSKDGIDEEVLKKTLPSALDEFSSKIDKLMKNKINTTCWNEFWLKISRRYSEAPRDPSESGPPDLSVHDFYLQSSLDDIAKASRILRGEEKDETPPSNPLEVAEATTWKREMEDLSSCINKFSEEAHHGYFADYGGVMRLLKQERPDIAERVARILSSKLKFADFEVELKASIVDAFNHKPF